MMNYLLSFLQLVLNLNTRPFVIKCAKLSDKTPIMDGADQEGRHEKYLLWWNDKRVETWKDHVML